MAYASFVVSDKKCLSVLLCGAYSCVLGTLSMKRKNVPPHHAFMNTFTINIPTNTTKQRQTKTIIEKTKAGIPSFIIIISFF